MSVNVTVESEPFREVLPKRGLTFHESSAQLVLCKPKLLPLKSFTLEKLDKMQKEAASKARDTILANEKAEQEEEEQRATGKMTHEPESVSFE